MLHEVDGKVYRKIKEQARHSCTGCVASEPDKEISSLCELIQETCGRYVCDVDHDTGEHGYIFEEVTGFNSTRELWAWLIDGNKVKYKSNLYLIPEDRVVFLENDMLYSTTGDRKTKYHLNLYNMYVPAIITTPEWYDNIPKQGILCWVHNYNKDRKDSISLIKEYDSTRENKFVNFRSEVRITAFGFATPLTEEELLERCYVI